MVKVNNLKEFYPEHKTTSFVKPTIQKKRRSQRRVVKVLLALLLISVVLTVCLRLKDIRESQESVSLKIVAPEEISAGEEISYLITYTNLEKASLTEVNLTLTYPADFYFSSASLVPANEGGNYWLLPDLPAGHTASLEVKGVMLGEVDETKTIQAVMAYEPANFSSVFSVNTEFNQKIKSNLVDMWVDYSPEAMPAQDLLFKIHVLNHLTEFSSLRVSFEKPEAFSILEVDPAIEASDRWEIEELEPEEESIITIHGELPPALTVESLNFTVYLWQELTTGERLLDEDELVIGIKHPDIKVSLIYVDDSASPVVNWGETINYQLTIVNQGDYVPEDMKLLLVLDNDFINWQAWQDSTGLYREDNKIIWTSENPKIGDKLRSLQSGEEINLKIGAKLQTAPIDAGSIASSDLTISAVAKIEAPLGNDSYVSTSDVLTSRIGQDIEFIARLKYYAADGTVRGSGPVPPQAEMATTYVVDWELIAGLNNWEDLEIKTTLPPQVVYSSGQGEVVPVFDPAARSLEISVADLAANQSLTGSFFVTVTPNKNQVGQLLTLLNPLTLVATNTGTEKTISQKIDSITSELLYDPVVQGQGWVIE